MESVPQGVESVPQGVESVPQGVELVPQGVGSARSWFRKELVPQGMKAEAAQKSQAGTERRTGTLKSQKFLVEAGVFHGKIPWIKERKWRDE